VKAIESLLKSDGCLPANVKCLFDGEEEIERLVRDFIARITPPTVRVTINTHIRSRPALIDRGHPALRAAATAYRRVFGRPPVWLRSGGSIPVVSEFQRLFGIPTVLMGFASPGDNLHGPNEKFSLRNFQRGILTSIALLQEFAAAPRCSAGCGYSTARTGGRA
jgi:acetylornithine deacetylase/succinyl-diaminopimelate desuccinylase-like protein